jgi:hypothetical protein
VKKKLLGGGLLLTVVLAFVAVQPGFISPALEPLPNGNYGELYGPVGQLRWILYLAFAFAIGLLVRSFFW